MITTTGIFRKTVVKGVGGKLGFEGWVELGWWKMLEGTHSST